MDLISELANVVPRERLHTGGEEVERHGGGVFTYHAPHAPDVVVYPESGEEVVEVLRYADERGVPVVPFGQGSSLEGHTIPVRGGISLDLGRMDRILEIRPDDFVARVEPGVTHGKLNAALKEHGLHFPVDPGWDASIGGMAGTNASGTNAVRYGAMRDQVLGLEVVLPGGKVMHTGGLAMKSSAGYHLTGLFVGSEGTLGVFTEITLRLYPIPEHILAARAVFPDVEAAARAAVAVIRSGMHIGRVELVDARTVEAVNAYKGTHYPVAPTLFLGTFVAGQSTTAGNVLIAINDNDADGRDVSWLWDVDFEMLAEAGENGVRFDVTGIRAHDMAVRLKYADLSVHSVVPDRKAALMSALGATPPGETLYVLPTYTAMLELRRVLSDLGYTHPFWQDT